MTAEAETERKRSELPDADSIKEGDEQGHKRAKLDVTDKDLNDKEQEPIAEAEAYDSSSPQKKKQHHRADTRGVTGRERTNTEGDDQTPRLPVSYDIQFE